MQIKSYIVNPGDSLSKIAAANGTTVEALMSVNANITNLFIDHKFYHLNCSLHQLLDRRKEFLLFCLLHQHHENSTLTPLLFL